MGVNIACGGLSVPCNVFVPDRACLALHKPKRMPMSYCPVSFVTCCCCSAGDTDTEGAETFVPGWRQALDAVLRWEEGAVGPTKQGGGVLESEPFGQEAGQKVTPSTLSRINY